MNNNNRIVKTVDLMYVFFFLKRFRTSSVTVQTNYKYKVLARRNGPCYFLGLEKFYLNRIIRSTVCLSISKRTPFYLPLISPSVHPSPFFLPVFIIFVLMSSPKSKCLKKFKAFVWCKIACFVSFVKKLIHVKLFTLISSKQHLAPTINICL